MNDAARVGSRHRVEQRREDRNGGSNVERADPRETRSEALAFEQVHHEDDVVANGEHLFHVDDAGVIEPLHERGFAQEALPLRGAHLFENLERDEGARVVPRRPHHPHPALAHHPFEDEATEPVAWRKQGRDDMAGHVELGRSKLHRDGRVGGEQREELEARRTPIEVLLCRGPALRAHPMLEELEDRVLVEVPHRRRRLPLSSS